ncbi:hypothetical protein Taro_000866 [Colocasia esculenta]|uniref:Uncharacterized protein n=1 Tax=Colocasia esculenta TaxID=4460 RepID=A0A843TG19_COLES|nr:hypothetical protein [Colocasia esculenta]
MRPAQTIILKSTQESYKRWKWIAALQSCVFVWEGHSCRHDLNSCRHDLNSCRPAVPKQPRKCSGKPSSVDTTPSSVDTLSQFDPESSGKLI